jgi:hypothetical protein
MWGQRYDVQFFHPQSNSHWMLSVDFRVPRQSPRACRSLAKLNVPWKCLSGVCEHLGDYASLYTRSYSVRSARIGSRREARRAGARQARTVTADSVAITAERTTESRGLVPCSIDWKMRVAAKLNGKPRPRPNSAGRRHRPPNSINCKS